MSFISVMEKSSGVVYGGRYNSRKGGVARPRCFGVWYSCHMAWGAEGISEDGAGLRRKAQGQRKMSFAGALQMMESECWKVNDSRLPLGL